MDFILDVYVGWCLFFCFSLEIGCTGMKSEILSIKIKCIKNREKEKWKMKDKIFGVLQRIGRSFMLPIAILPVAGPLLDKEGVVIAHKTGSGDVNENGVLAAHNDVAYICLPNNISYTLAVFVKDFKGNESQAYTLALLL